MPGCAVQSKRLRVAEFIPGSVKLFAHQALVKWFTLMLKDKSLRVDPRNPSFHQHFFNNAVKVFSVSRYLAELAKDRAGLKEGKVNVIPNGIDEARFEVLERSGCREKLGIEPDKKVIISVGALAERKGHHRVISVLPDLVRDHPDLLYVIVGGPSIEGDLR